MATSHDHQHGRTCYWDHLRCGWACPAPPPPVPTTVPDAEAQPVTETAADLVTTPLAVVG